METHPFLRAEFYSKTDKPEMITFNRRDHYKIWLISGNGILRFAGRSVHIDRPALVFFNPATPYTYEHLERIRTGGWCVFNEDFFLNSSRFENLQESPLFKIGAENVFFPDEKQLTVITFLLEQIIAELNSRYAHRYQSIQHYIYLLIHEGMKMQPVSEGGERQNAAVRITSLFLDLLEKQFPIETPQQSLQLKTPGDFAKELSVHVNHLNAVVQEVTGKSTRAHIAERMVGESKALLTYSSWSVADIAYSLGFEYPNHFTNFFKKHTGVTPLTLRK